MVSIPKNLVLNQGGSGDALIVRTDTGWAATKSGEIPMSGLRRVENWVPEKDPINWDTSIDGTGQNPVIGNIYEADGMLWREVTFKPGSSGSSYLHSTVSLGGLLLPVWSSVWLRTPPGAGSLTLYRLTASLSSAWPGAALWSLQLTETPQRFVTKVSGFEKAIGVGLTARDSASDQTIWIAIDDEHCATADISPLPYTGNNFFYCAEVVSPTVDYGFGADGVAYFAYENPYTVDSNGVVTDTGSRVPLVGGGIIAPGAETENIPNNTFSELGAGGSDVFDNWAETVAGTSTVNQETSDLPAGFATACRFDIDSSASQAKIDQALTTTAAAGEEWYLSFLCKAASTSGLKFTITATDGSSTYYYDGTSWGTTAADFQPNDLPTSWDAWKHKMTALPSGITSFTNIAVSNNSGSSVSHRFTNVMLTKTDPSHVRIRTTTSAVSRGTTYVYHEYVPENTRRLRMRIEVDTSKGINAGTLIGAQDSGETTKLGILKIEYDSGSSTYRLRIDDGTTNMQVATAIPSKEGCIISVDLAKNGGKVKIDGTETTHTTGFDFSWVSRIYIGSDPTADNINLPIKLLTDYY